MNNLLEVARYAGTKMFNFGQLNFNRIELHWIYQKITQIDEQLITNGKTHKHKCTILINSVSIDLN